MLCRFLYQRDQDQAHEIVRHPPLLNDVVDFLDQENSGQAHTGQGHCNCQDALGQCELGSFDLLVSILVPVFVVLEYFVEYTTLTVEVVPQEPTDGISSHAVGGHRIEKRQS